MKSVVKKKDCLSEDEVESIRESEMTLKERAIFELMVSTGLRVGEVALLKVSDIDFVHRRVSVYGVLMNGGCKWINGSILRIA